MQFIFPYNFNTGHNNIAHFDRRIKVSLFMKLSLNHVFIKLDSHGDTYITDGTNARATTMADGIHSRGANFFLVFFFSSRSPNRFKPPSALASTLSSFNGYGSIFYEY